MGSRMETGVSGKTDLIVFCDEGRQELDQAQSEGLFFLSVMSLVCL